MQARSNFLSVEIVTCALDGGTSPDSLKSLLSSHISGVITPHEAFTRYEMGMPCYGTGLAHSIVSHLNIFLFSHCAKNDDGLDFQCVMST